MKVLIELEFNDYDNENLSDDYVKESVYTYLKQLINNDNLDYTIEGLPMIHEDTEFPFDEIKLPSGDYFETVDQAMKQTGLSVDHVWSVTYDDHKDDENIQVYITGPSHHYCNLIGYIATEKPHDGLTVYIENLVVI